MAPKVSIVLSIAGMLAASSVAAQRTGTRLDANRGAAGSISRTDPSSAVRVVHAYGMCLAQREGKSMRRALDLPLGSAEQAKAVSGNANYYDECLGVSADFDQVTFGPLLSAGAAAEFFMTHDLRRVDLSSLKGMSDEAVEKSDCRARNSFEDLGLCVVRRDPTRARALIATRPTTAEEKAAFTAVQGDIGPCVSAGTTMTFNIPNLRAVIAYGLYRAASKLGAVGA